MGHNLLRVGCFTWVLRQSLRNGGLTSTEKEDAVVGEDNWSGEWEASPNL